MKSVLFVARYPHSKWMYLYEGSKYIWQHLSVVIGIVTLCEICNDFYVSKRNHMGFLQLHVRDK